MKINNNLKATSVFKVIVVFASVLFSMQIFSTTIIFAQNHQNKKVLAKVSNKASPSLQTISAVRNISTQPTVARTTQNSLQSEGERQAQMVRSAVDFGKKYFPIIVLLGASVIIIGRNLDRILPKKNSNSTSHGSAHFATRSEMKHLFRRMTKPIRAGEMRIGIYREEWRLFNKYINLPRDVVNRHVLVVGPSGAGKSRAIFLPNCHYNKGASFLATDPKSELWEKTSGHQEMPLRFSPMEPDGSMAFNPIPACKEEIDMAEGLAISIVYARGESGDPFWYQNEKQLLTALIVHTADTSVPTLPHLYEMLCMGGKRVVELLQKSTNVSAKRLSSSFVGLNDKVLTGTVQGLMGKLSWLENPKVRRFTGSVDYTFDFSQLRKKPMQLYWCLNEDDVSKVMELTAAFFNMGMVALKRANGKVPVTFYFDEFGNVGKLSNFEKDITLIRGRDLAVVGCLQNIAQLETLYGKVNAKIIWANFNTKFVLNGLENETAEIISKTLGDYTYTQEKLAKSSKAGNFLGGNSSLTESEQSHGRKLKTADELRTYTRKEMIVISTDMNPMSVERIYYDEPLCPANIKGCTNEIAIPSYA